MWSILSAVIPSGIERNGKANIGCTAIAGTQLLVVFMSLARAGLGLARRTNTLCTSQRRLASSVTQGHHDSHGQYSREGKHDGSCLPNKLKLDLQILAVPSGAMHLLHRWSPSQHTITRLSLETKHTSRGGSPSIKRRARPGSR